jgi:hypothetical protein
VVFAPLCHLLVHSPPRPACGQNARACCVLVSGGESCMQVPPARCRVRPTASPSWSSTRRLHGHRCVPCRHCLGGHSEAHARAQHLIHASHFLHLLPTTHLRCRTTHLRCRTTHLRRRTAIRGTPPAQEEEDTLLKQIMSLQVRPPNGVYWISSAHIQECFIICECPTITYQLRRPHVCV